MSSSWFDEMNRRDEPTTMPNAYRDGHEIRHSKEISELAKLKNYRVRHAVFRVVDAHGEPELDKIWDRITAGDFVLCDEQKVIAEGSMIIALKWMEPRASETKKADPSIKLIEKPAVSPGEDTKVSNET